MLHKLIEGDSSDISLFLMVHAVHRLPDGRPLLHISCMDNDMAMSLYTSEADSEIPKVWLVTLIDYNGALEIQPCLHHASCWSWEYLPSKMPVRNCECGNGELLLLRRVLARNAQRLVVPQWQKDLTTGGPESSATFLLPLYSGRMDTEENVRPMTLALRIWGNPTHTLPPESPPAVESMSCLACGKHASMRCSRCQRVFFCGVACQKKAWPVHKKTCKAP
jgi:hypothetical protein